MTSKMRQLDDLLAEVREHQNVGGDAEVLDFVRRMRHLGPYNAALVLLQRPGARYVASAADWRHRFGRTIKHGSNPVLILVPFGPVQLLYDISDTEGPDLPDRILDPFATEGEVTESGLDSLIAAVGKLGIDYRAVERGSVQAGEMTHESSPHHSSTWTITVSTGLTPASKVATIFHELGHMFAGHLGSAKTLDITSRIDELKGADPATKEIEAEAIAWLLCSRIGVTPQSGKYIAGHLADRSLPPLSLDLILSVTGRIESKLGGAEKLNDLLGDDRLVLFPRS